MSLQYRIDFNPRVWVGKPRIKGARILDSVIIEQIAEEKSWDAVIASYPELKKEDIQAALHFMRASIQQTEAQAVGA